MAVPLPITTKWKTLVFVFCYKFYVNNCGKLYQVYLFTLKILEGIQAFYRVVVVVGRLSLIEVLLDKERKWNM